MILLITALPITPPSSGGSWNIGGMVGGIVGGLCTLITAVVVLLVLLRYMEIRGACKILISIPPHKENLSYGYLLLCFRLNKNTGIFLRQLYFECCFVIRRKKVRPQQGKKNENIYVQLDTPLPKMNNSADILVKQSGVGTTNPKLEPTSAKPIYVNDIRNLNEYSSLEQKPKVEEYTKLDLAVLHT